MPFAGLAEALAERERAHLLRRRRVVTGASTPEIRVDGQSLLAFCSNDYLGLANHPKVVEAFTRAASEYGVGSGASDSDKGSYQWESVPIGKSLAPANLYEAQRPATNQK